MLRCNETTIAATGRDDGGDCVAVNSSVLGLVPLTRHQLAQF